MSNLSLRPSTIKRSEATKERLKVREEIKKSKRISKVLGGLRSSGERSYSEGALELVAKASEVYGEDSEEDINVASPSKEKTVREEIDLSNNDGDDNPHFF